MDILESLKYNDFLYTTPEDAESERCHDALYQEICKYIPAGNINIENKFSDLIGLYSAAEDMIAYRRGVRFAVAFMSEALRPPMKTYSDIDKEIKSTIRGA